MSVLTRRQFLAGTAASAGMILLSRSLAGCTTGGGAAATASAGATGGASGAATGKIEVMNRWVYDPEEPTKLQAMFDEFAKAHPGVSVVNSSTSSSADTYHPAVNNAFASGNPPALASVIAGPTVYQLAQAGVLADLSDFYNSSLKTNDQGGAAVQGVVLDDKVWGLSTDLNVGNLLWYNPTYLEKYGLKGEDVKSYADWLEQLKTIKDAGGVPILFGTKDLSPAGHYMGDLMQRTMGNEAAVALYNRTVLPNQPDTYKWTDDAVVEAFQMLADLAPYFQDGYLSQTTNAADQMFLLGGSAYHEQGSWMLATAQSSPPGFDLKMYPFPAIEGYPGKGTDLTLSSETLVCSKGAAPDLVEPFLEWFLSPEISARFSAMNASFSPWKLGGNKVEVPDVGRAWYDTIQGFLDNTGDGGAILFNDEVLSADLYPKYIWNGSIALMTGQTTPKDLAQQIEDQTVTFQKTGSFPAA